LKPRKLCSNWAKGPHIKGRIDVDQLQAALGFDLLAQGPIVEGAEDQLVVAPDQFVRPALELASAEVGAEQIRLQLLHRIQRLLGARLIHLLDRLERQHRVADRVGLAVPDQLHLAFVFT
jgi:hypothetical protein